GYKGLAELRHALAEGGDNPAPRERLLRTLDHIPPDEVLSTTLDDHLAGLDDLAHDVDPASFQRAVEALTSRARIAWRGVGPSSTRPCGPGAAGPGCSPATAPRWC